MMVLKYHVQKLMHVAIARDSVPLRRWSDTYLYELYHSIPFFVHSLGLIAVTIPSMKTHCISRASP